jgi:DNA-binding XRE family transcriptional regulator
VSAAARALLGWKQRELAAAAGLSEVSIKNAERGVVDSRGSTLDAIQRAFDRAGVVFLDTGDTRNGGPGVRNKPPPNCCCAHGSRSRSKPSLFCQSMRPSSEHNISGWDKQTLKARVAFAPPNQGTLAPPETALATLGAAVA